MEIQWSLYILVVLVSLDPTQSHQGSQGLSCVNDFVNNVTCTWNGSLLGPGVNCSISGLKMSWDVQIIRSCKVEQRGNSPPGCSFVFENKLFTRFKDMPYIRMECDGKMVENITNYKPADHIKMHPPGVPHVNTTANETLISWSTGSPLSIFFTSFDFQVQIAQKNQTWEEAHSLSVRELKIKILSWKLKGHCRVRVRVSPIAFTNSHWSNWSPTTYWMGTTEVEAPPPMNQDWLVCGVMFSFGLILFVLLVLYKSCVRKGLHKEKPLPNPSKYFHTLHSVHGGNLKTWLNPPSAPESFFTAQPRDHISAVLLCENSIAVRSTSPSTSSTRAPLHLKSYPSAGSDTSGVLENSSSSSSSFFYNMGYFLTSSSSSPVYFTYQDDSHSLHNRHNLHLCLCPSITTSATYESLKMEPQSPDSGFGIGTEDEEDKMVVGVERAEVFDNHQTSPLLMFPLPSRMCPPSSPPPSPNAPSLIQVSSDSPQVDTAVAAASGSYTAWPLAGTMCRSSSMPVEPCRTGYLTLKELQTTFSNKSI